MRVPPLVWFAIVASLACTPDRLAERVPMRDGTRLATDVYLPPGNGPFPAVVARTPYDKVGHVLLADGLNAAGVALVAQDMRGRFASEGIDAGFRTDRDDGHDTLGWVVDQPWSNGAIGTLGDSAEGIVQYVQAAADPPGLAVMYVGLATPHLYRDAVFQGGVYRHSLVHEWLADQGSLHLEAEFAAHPFEDAYWEPTRASDHYGEVHVPAYHQGGWFDIFQQGTLDAFVGYQHAGGDGAAGRQKLVIGPWTHVAGWRRDQGELTFPPSAATSPSANVLDVLFDDALALSHTEIDTAPSEIPAVQYYVMGDVDDPDAPGNVWRTADDWPVPAAPIRWHLQPGGGLSEADPDGAASTAYVFDPADPAPTVCGNNLYLEAGPCDQRLVEARDDVVTFTSLVLSEPVEITGRVSARLFVELDRPDADLVVKLLDVYPDGRSMQLAEGAHRLATRGSTTQLTPLDPGEIVEAVVDLWSTSIVVNVGHRIRVSVTSSSWPRYAVNHGNGLPFPASVTGEPRPVTVRLHHGADHPSWIELPDPTRAGR